MSKIDLNLFKDKLEEGWFEKLKPFLESEEMYNIIEYLKTRRQEERMTIYPKSNEFLNAFYYCPFDKTKIVIFGQDPYHNGKADGLAFSNSKTPLSRSPSLNNILKEVENDMYDGFNIKLQAKSDLTYWAEQGILLLNTALTVEKGVPGSHIKLWEPFTKYVLDVLREKNVLYIMWGKKAQKWADYLEPWDVDKNLLTAAHPSPYSANKGFFECRHFSKANEWIKNVYGLNEQISW